ncbi:MAG: FtsQ-type POTRA domain-containing protein [Acidimicrobiia bacterium]|nr:FtsQ-type POTRA domain-containing protein [Acidimicrobiia bacterium]NNC42972.1 FtsQ-type POTRA domain-containing protein [Acidimicrobiia bacterium]NNL47331.1 FtsQ-type POTRA domain-containing protein [Acidimicrobiia bacterium]
MDPRIALRRREVESTRLRIVGRRIVLVLSGIIVVMGAVWAINTPMFSIRHVDVVGQLNSAVSSRLDQAGLVAGTPLLLADLSAGEEAILLDPWVKAVELDRQFPDRLVVKVAERMEVAVLDSGLTVSDDGRVMRESTGAELTRLHVDGSPVNSYLTGSSAEAVDLIIMLDGTVTDVAYSDVGLVAWYEGIETIFGSTEELSTKAAVAALMRGEVQPGESLDVSVPERPVIRSSGDSTMAPTPDG